MTDGGRLFITVEGQEYEVMFEFPYDDPQWDCKAKYVVKRSKNMNWVVMKEKHEAPYFVLDENAAEVSNEIQAALSRMIFKP
jgi:hypothetical protein